MRASNLFLVFLIASVSTLAQGVPYNASKKIKINPGVHRLDSLLKQVSKKSGATFSFDTKKINATKSVNWTLKEGTVKEIVSELGNLIEIEAIEVENHIVLVSRPKPPKTQSPKPIQNREPDQKPIIKKAEPKNESPNKVVQTAPTSLAPVASVQEYSYEPKVESSPQIKSEIDTTETKETITSDSAIQPVHDAFPAKTESVITTQAKPVTVEQAQIDSNKKSIAVASKKSPASPEPPKADKPKKSIPFFIKAGVAANEIMYTNASLQVGIPFVYGVVSAGTNFKLNELRYGVGSSFNLNDTWRLNLQLDYGSLSKKFTRRDSLNMIDSSEYSTSAAIKVKSESARINILFERKLGKNFTFQFGPTITAMKTEYFLNGEISNAGALGSNADKKYRTISPPLLISNSYDTNSSSNIKVWLGVQVGLFYQLGPRSNK